MAFSGAERVQQHGGRGAGGAGERVGTQGGDETAEGRAGGGEGGAARV